MRSGTRLAIDWGAARIGVAACDADAILCYPVETVPNTPAALSRIAALAAEHKPIEILIGLPVSLRGRDEQAANEMRGLAQRLARAVQPVPVRLVDERLSTASAHRRLAQAGRNSRQRRGIVDQAAAVAILEGALDRERSTSAAAGEKVTVDNRKGERR